MIAETYVELVTDPNHWFLEITIMIVFDVVIGYFIWGAIKRHIHRDDETLEEKIQREITAALAHMHDDSGVTHEEM